MSNRLFALLPLLLLLTGVRADHYAGGSITTRCTGGNFHEITLQLFRNCTGTALIAQDLYFTNDCGVEFQQTLPTPVSTQDVSRLCTTELPNSSCNGGSLIGFELATFQTTVYLSPCTNWRISWNICCRNSSLNVISNPGMYLETVLDNTGGSCTSSPVFDQDFIPTVCVGQEVSHDASAEGDPSHRLSYHLIDARFGSPAPLPVNYMSGFSGAEPYAGMQIDSISGEITFQATTVGSVITAVEVREFDGDEMIRTVMRDFLFVITNCTNTPPTLTSGLFTSSTGSASVIGDRALSVCGGDGFCASISITDIDASQSIALVSDATEALAGATLTTTGTNPVMTELCWGGAAPGTYSFSIIASDDACPIIGSRRYDYTITVLDPSDPGTGSDADVCANGTPVALFSFLGGNPDTEGTWEGPDGSSVSGTFMPGISLPGTYSYIVGDASCSSTAVVQVSVIPADDPNCITAGLEDDTAINIVLIADRISAHRFWLQAPSMTGTLRMLAADGRILSQQHVTTRTGVAIPFDVPLAHQGLVIVQLNDVNGTVHLAQRMLVLGQR
ncbi:MAG: hypothetical protein JNM62_16505 [Flavobacteriales bacterium]|nr:hypothetical protein [Flavobacteriales bacterium]